VVIPPVMRIRATSNGEQRVQVLISVAQRLSQKQRQLMQQCVEILDWQGLKLPSAERRQRDNTLPVAEAAISQSQKTPVSEAT